MPEQKIIVFNPARKWGFSGALFLRKGISWSFELSSLRWIVIFGPFSQTARDNPVNRVIG